MEDKKPIHNITNREWEAILPNVGTKFELGSILFEVTHKNAGQRRVTITMKGLGEKAITDMTNKDLPKEFRGLLQRIHAFFKGTNPANVTLGVHSATIGSGSKFVQPKKEDKNATDKQ